MCGYGMPLPLGQQFEAAGTHGVCFVMRSVRSYGAAPCSCVRKPARCRKLSQHLSESFWKTLFMCGCCVCRWSKPLTNYDNIAMATFTLWQISTTELWVNTMYSAIAAVGVDQQPRSGHNPVLALFFIAFIIFGGKGCCRLLSDPLFLGSQPSSTVWPA